MLNCVSWACFFCRDGGILTGNRSRTKGTTKQRGDEGGVFESAGPCPSVCRDVETFVALRQVQVEDGVRRREPFIFLTLMPSDS